MNSIFFRSSSPLLPSSPVIHKPSPHLHFPKLQYNPNPQFHLKTPKFRSLCTTQPPGTIPMVNSEDLHEKDWSFLEQDDINSPEEQTQKTNLIISQGDVRKGRSKVLVSFPNELFMERLVETDPMVILAVHDSLSVLAGIKEKHDDVRCWQGELVYVPNKWNPFHVVFLCCLPAIPFDLDQIFGVIALNSFVGARLVISYAQGREGVERQRKDHPDVVIADLPNKLSLEKAAADHSFEITKFVDEPRFYLATLKYFGPNMCYAE